ncbi:CREG family protein, partial [Leeia sp. TBRC 13508]
MKIPSHAIQYTIRSCFEGTLATNSIQLPQYPHASWIQLCTDFQGMPIFIISHLAEHTKNLVSDPRCSLLVTAQGETEASPKRLTILGQAKAFTPSEIEISRFSKLIPQSALYLNIGGFEFYRLTPEKVRFISSFGKMGWLNLEEYIDNKLASCNLSSEELTHLNHLQKEKRVEIVAVDSFGVSTVNLETQKVHFTPTDNPLNSNTQLIEW